MALIEMETIEDAIAALVVMKKLILIISLIYFDLFRILIIIV
jgi:hypothetical protein